MLISLVGDLYLAYFAYKIQIKMADEEAHANRTKAMEEEHKQELKKLEEQKRHLIDIE